MLLSDVAFPSQNIGCRETTGCLARPLRDSPPWESWFGDIEDPAPEVGQTSGFHSFLKWQFNKKDPLEWLINFIVPDMLEPAMIPVQPLNMTANTVVNVIVAPVE